MTGWEKVGAATLVAVIGLLALNLAIWRRMRAATRSGHGRDLGAVQSKQDDQGVIQPDHVRRAEVADNPTDPSSPDRTDLVGHEL